MGDLAGSPFQQCLSHHGTDALAALLTATEETSRYLTSVMIPGYCLYVYKPDCCFP